MVISSGTILSIGLVVWGTGASIDNTCSSKPTGTGGTIPKTKEKFLAILPINYPLTLVWGHPCKLPEPVDFDITSKPGGLQKTKLPSQWPKLLNTAREHMGLLLETDPSITPCLCDFSVGIRLPLLAIQSLGSEYFAVFPQLHGIDVFHIGVVTLSTRATIQVEVRLVKNKSHTEVVVVNVVSLEAFVVSRPSDMSGSRVLSDKSISVSCMFGMMQNIGIIPVIPVKVLGKRYSSLPSLQRQDVIVRLVIVSNATFISIHDGSKTERCWSRGDVVDVNVNSVRWYSFSSFYANRPLLVLQLVLKDGSIFFINPVEHYRDYISHWIQYYSPHSVQCIFIHFYETVNVSLTFVNVNDLTVTKVEMVRVATHTEVNQPTFTFMKLNRSIDGLGTFYMSSFHNMSATCVVEEMDATFYIAPDITMDNTYKECRLIRNVAVCDHCNSTYSEVCDGDRNVTYACPEEGNTSSPLTILEITGIAVTSIIALVVAQISATKLWKYHKGNRGRSVSPGQDVAQPAP